MSLTPFGHAETGSHAADSTPMRTDEGQVLVRIDHRPEGRIALVTLNDPRRLNCLNPAMAHEFRAKVAALAGDAELRAMVLTGAGERSFIAGADIHDMKDLTPAKAPAFIRLVHDMARICQDLPVPVVARINGFCLGAGPAIIAACDLRVACEEATFAMPEVRVGLPSVIEAALLPRLIGWGRTQEFIYTGEAISARKALDWGLVNTVVPRADLDAAIERTLGAILRCGPHAIRIQKELFRAWARMSVGDSVAEGIRAFRRSFETGEPNRMFGAHFARLKSNKAAEKS
jgi:enoyl-CoA hydratase/carnithine racemase